MNLVKIIDEFKLQKCGAFICKRCDADIPDIREYKYIDGCQYWYGENHLDENPWIDVEGMGYGSIWCGNWLRRHSKFLQRQAIRKYAGRFMKLMREKTLVLTYRFDGAECFGFMIGDQCYVQIITEKRRIGIPVPEAP